MKLYNANDIDLILKMEVTRHIELLPVASPRLIAVARPHP